GVRGRRHAGEGGTHHAERISVRPAHHRGSVRMAGQGGRDFVAAYERACPGEVVRVREPVTTEYDVMALVLEYERRRRWPVLLFEQVTGPDIPIVANVVASRTAPASALPASDSRP